MPNETRYWDFEVREIIYRKGKTALAADTAISQRLVELAERKAERQVLPKESTEALSYFLD